ncbi:transcription factor S-II, central domain-containing protein [Phascolomyces articulosus]|uniref:Transcription factor BYE1 n=1 Tax=Phascolomyces articulosus TaxID=60185 RepID=A0AAD5JQW3_9FUNG|nr:transcription factor S-II, central domain-containing protein [Phascolomyces articulosus]
MDIHNNFDEFLDLRDQQEEGLQQQQQQENKIPLEQQTSITNASTVPTWNLEGTDGNLVSDNNNDAADAAAAAAAAAVVAGASVDPNQAFYFPLDSAGWASVFASTSEMNTAALTAFINDTQQPTTTTVAETNTTDTNVSHFIPPQQMLLQQPITTTTTTTAASAVPESTDMDMLNKQIEDVGNNMDHDEKQEPKQEEDTRRMRTRSSTRLRMTVTKPTSPPPSSSSSTKTPVTTKQDESKKNDPETPKKKGKGKKLYCVCQKPYTGEPMVQCDKCTQWFHCECVDLDPDEAEDIEMWVCKDCEAKQRVSDEQEATSEEQKVSQVKEEQSPVERPYATRQAKARKCLLPSCKNRTRADSYCSDVCATKDTMRKSGDSEYIPTKSPSPPKERRPRIPSSASSTTSISTIASTTDKKSPTSVANKTLEPTTPTTVPEEDPIRKNVVKNMSSVLKTIIEAALEKDPHLFATTINQEASQKEQEAREEEEQKEDPQVKADKIANAIEQAMFKELRDIDTRRAGVQYKNKFRSLLHNLKDKANEGFQLRVVTGELTPDDLVKMSSEDMANPELRSMSMSMRQESIKNSIMKRANVPIIKKTHKGDIIMIGAPDKEENNIQQQPQHIHQDRPRWMHRGSKDTMASEESNSRKSSFSEGGPTVVSRNEREDEQRFEDILARIGIGHREEEGNDEHNDGTSSSPGKNKKRNNRPLDGVDRPKKRKVEIDMEKLLGEEDDYQPEFSMDDDNNKEQAADGSTTPPYPPPPSPPAIPTGPPKPPTIWNGRVNMPQVSEFEACARQIGGRVLSEAEWAEVLSPTMWIEGRIPIDRVTQYVTQTQYATSREIVLLEIEATGPNNYQNAQTLIKYFASRKRYGVVGHNKTKIKDFYLVPLYKTEQLPDCLYVVRVEEALRDVDMFLGVLVIQKPQELPAVAATPTATATVPIPVRQHHPQPQQQPSPVVSQPFTQQQQPPYSNQYQIPSFLQQSQQPYQHSSFQQPPQHRGHQQQQQQHHHHHHHRHPQQQHHYYYHPPPR